ncbi:hypothetical protein B0H14DRAFT_2627058 [Mycena olivaceomarginata]|nr:hypothetical protein B0H14DRAFT_2627058 [Mycena olivaceomarginata]
MRSQCGAVKWAITGVERKADAGSNKEDKIQSRDTKEFADRGSMEVGKGISQNVAERAMGMVEERSKRLGGKIEKNTSDAMSGLRVRAACRVDYAKTADRKCEMM